MSVTGTYCLWLHRHPSTAALSELIDGKEWGCDKPQRGARGGDTLYYWSGTRGPFFKKEVNGKVQWPSLESLIDEVVQAWPELVEHYALFVWVENQYQRTDGHYDYHLHPEKIIMIHDPHEIYRDYEDHRHEVRTFFEAMTRT